MGTCLPGNSISAKLNLVTTMTQVSPLHANKIILGPMVRVSTLPMRLLSLRYGADLVYTEEIIDFKLIKSKRFVNKELNTIDFIDDTGYVVFRTCQEETDKVILQIGTSDAERAVLAAKKVEDDVAGIDINMGCPKSFSLKGGMGAALLEKPQQIKAILTLLKANIRKPVSCKIRVFENLDATVRLAQMIEQTGVDALAIHGRTKEERPQHHNRSEYIRTVTDHTVLPIIANGDSGNIQCYQDIERFKQQTNASSVMVCRAAIKNCSVFNKSNQLQNIATLIAEYLKIAIDYDNNPINTKYCIQHMMGTLQDSTKGKQLNCTHDHGEMSKIFNVYDYYQAKVAERNSKRSVSPQESKLCSQADHVELPVIFDKNAFSQDTLPKTVLNRWIAKNNLDKPSYQTYQVEKQFHSVVRFMQKQYSTPYLEKTKKFAEQAAAMVLILKYGLCDDSKVLEACLVGQSREKATLECTHNGRTYLIQVNK